MNKRIFNFSSKSIEQMYGGYGKNCPLTVYSNGEKIDLEVKNFRYFYLEILVYFLVSL